MSYSIIILIIGLLIVLGLIYSFFKSFKNDVPRKIIEARYAKSESKFITLDNGSRIHTLVKGNPDGPVLVLLHGYLASLFTFDKVVPQLSEKYKVVCLDFPAFGLTGAVPNKDYSIESFIETVNQVVKKLSIDKFYLLGHSMGGRVAWRYAIKYPDQVKKLILVGSGVLLNEGDLERFERQNIPKAFRYIGANFPYKEKFVYFTPKFFAKQGAKVSVYDQNLVTDEMVDQYYDLPLLEGSRQALADMALMNEVKDLLLDDENLLQQIKVPSLMIHGDKDNIIGLWATKPFENNINNLKIKIFKNMGHMPMIEDPIGVVKEINDFIKID